MQAKSRSREVDMKSSGAEHGAPELLQLLQLLNFLYCTCQPVFFILLLWVNPLQPLPQRLGAGGKILGKQFFMPLNKSLPVTGRRP
jgi:hypothetical protein